MKSLLLVLFTVFLASCVNTAFDKDGYYYEILDKEEFVYTYKECVHMEMVEFVEHIKLFLVKDSNGAIYKVKPPIEDWNRYEIGDKVVTKCPYTKWQL